MKVRALPSLPSRTAHCLFPLPVYTSTRGIPNPERLGTRLPFSSFTLIERRLLSIDGARFVLGGTARVGAAVVILGLSFVRCHAPQRSVRIDHDRIRVNMLTQNGRLFSMHAPVAKLK